MINDLSVHVKAYMEEVPVRKAIDSSLDLMNPLMRLGSVIMALNSGSNSEMMKRQKI